jgi:hypothetical protein
MTKNMGGIDRGIRLVLGAVILWAGLSGGHWWGWIGVVPILTAFVGICPGYLPFRINTGAAKQPKT